jgi:hypothetical protein
MYHLKLCKFRAGSEDQLFETTKPWLLLNEASSRFCGLQITSYTNTILRQKMTQSQYQGNT